MLPRCLLRAGLPGPLDALPPSGLSPQLSDRGEGPRLGERSISSSPAPPGGLEDNGETDFLCKRGEKGERDLLWDRGEGEQEVGGSCKCWGAESRETVKYQLVTQWRSREINGWIFQRRFILKQEQPGLLIISLTCYIHFLLVCVIL